MKISYEQELIIIAGGQGAGKGTISNRLLSVRDLNYIETGNIFRQMPTDSEIGKLIASGNLVPDEKLFDLMDSKITLEKPNLLDGFPRTAPQAKWLIENYSDQYDISVLFLDVPEKILLQRIENRTKTSKNVRSDDVDMDSVKKRLNSFYTKTVPALEILEHAKSVNFHRINGKLSIEENIAQVFRALKMRQQNKRTA